MMEDAWLCVDEDSSSNESFSNSDKIDSETEAELYSLIHFEDNLSNSNCYNSTPKNALTSDTCIHTSEKMKYILSTEKNEETEIVDCLKPPCQNGYVNSIEKKRPYCESLFLNELAEKLNPDKKKKIDSDQERLEDFLRKRLNDSTCNQSYNLNKSDLSSPKCANSLNENSRILSESSDSDIWAEVDTSNENNIQTNVHKDEDLVYISSDSEPEILPSFEMRLSNLKNRMSMPNLKLRERFQDAWFINQEDLNRHKRGRSRRYHDNFENTCTNCNKKGHNARICPSPRIIKCFICGGGHVGASCINRMCGKCYDIGHDSARCLQPVIGHCVLCRLYGHTKENCPDLWRRYHLTTKLGKIVRGKQVRQDTFLYCCNCGEIGHIGAVCREYRGNKNCLSTLPIVLSYDDPEKLLRLRLRDNSRSNATMNKKSKRQKDNKAKQAKRKQKRKAKLERSKEMKKEAVKEKDFPRTQKTNTIPNPPSDNVPAFVKKIIAMKRKRREKRKLKRLEIKARKQNSQAVA